MNYKKVPCLIAEDLEPEKVQSYRLADNKTGEYADWHIELLENANITTYNFTMYSRDVTNLQAWAYVDSNFSGNKQSDEPISPSTGVLSGGDISGISLTVSLP